MKVGAPLARKLQQQSCPAGRTAVRQIRWQLTPWLNTQLQRRSSEMGTVETYLMERAGTAGYDVLDAIVQANVPIERLSVEELETIVSRFAERPQGRERN